MKRQQLLESINIAVYDDSKSGQKFKDEIGCVRYLLNRLIRGEIKSEYSHLYFHFNAPKELDKSLRTPRIESRVSGVLKIDCEFDFEGYSTIDLQNRRYEYFCAFFSKTIDELPNKYDIDRSSIKTALGHLSDYNYEYSEKIGTWECNSERTYSALLNLKYVSDGIYFSVDVKNLKTSHVYHKYFARYYPGDPVILELGKIKFLDETNLIYTPTGLIPPQIFSIEPTDAIPILDSMKLIEDSLDLSE